MPADQETTDARGLTRRQLVTRGAIVGGLVWAAPVIRTTAAYATTANGTERPCQNFYMVVINPAGHVLPAPARIQYHTTPPAIRRWFRDNSGVTVQFPAIKPQLTAVSDEEAAVLLPEVTGPNAAGRQCRMVLGFARKGETDFAEAFVDPDPPIAVAVGRRLIFPCPRVACAPDDGLRRADDTSCDDGIAAESVAGPSVGAPRAASTTSTTTTTTTTLAPAVGSAGALDSAGALGTQPVGPSTAAPAASTAVGSDGTSSDSIGTDGSSGPTIGSDGRPSKKTGDHGNGRCFDSLYLIYCCPR